MARCDSCSAVLSRDTAWCARCFDPLMRELPPAPPGPPTVLTLPGEPEPEPQHPEWGPLPEDLVLIASATPPPERLLVLPETEPPSLFPALGYRASRGRRLAITAILVAIGLGSYLFLERWGVAIGDRPRLLEIVVAIAYASMAGFLLALVWRPVRQSPG